MHFLLLVSLVCFSLPFVAEATLASALSNLQRRAEESASEAVIVARDRQIIFQYSKSLAKDPIDSQEMSKACVALAYAFLIEEQKIPSLDVPVRFYFSDSEAWNAGWLASLTLKHLLSETSGLDSKECISINGQDSIVSAIFVPGEEYSENGNNTRLLLKLIEKISGQTFDAYLQKKLFTPLGIQTVSWSMADVGQPLHLYLLADDWMKIGQFLLGKAFIGQKTVLGNFALQQIFTPSQVFTPFLGIGWNLEFYDVAAWWDESLLQWYRYCGVASPLVDLLEGLYGRQIHFTGKMQSAGNLHFQPVGTEHQLAGIHNDLISVLYEKGLPLCRFRAGKLKAFSCFGRGGQQLYIYPQGKIVAFRQKKLSQDKEMDAFADFSDLVEQLSFECEGWVD